MPNPVTTSFDAYELAITLAKNTFKGAKEQDFVTGYVDVEGPDYSPLPDGVEIHAQYGLGPMIKRGETDPFTFDSPGPAGTVKRWYEAYALAVVLTERLLMMSKYGIANKVTTDLGRSWRLRQNLHVASAYDDFFTGATFTGLDGLALGTASHTTFGAEGVTRSNITTGPFSYTTAPALLTVMRKMKSERGYANPTVFGSVDVIIPPALEFEVEKILNPGSVYEPITNNNAVNVMHTSGRKYNIKINPFLSSETAWWFANPTEKGIKLVNRQNLTTDTNPDIETKGVRHDARGMWCIVEEAWEMIFGSAGSVV